MAPLKRPSVIRATSLSRPRPTIAEVGVSISGIPGAPFGPQLRITMTLPLRIWSPEMAANASVSLSNTWAGPR